MTLPLNLSGQNFGVMLHHFTDSTHQAIQGALTEHQFLDLLDHLGSRVTDAQTWRDKALKGSLTDEICITFDDALLSQIDIALPVLESRGLTAFWFIYTEPLEGTASRLELYRFFRNSSFPDIDSFYCTFRRVAEQAYGDDIERELKGFVHSDYLPQSGYYTDADREFRFVRDQVLGPARYDEIMDRMIVEAGVDVTALSKTIWLTSDHVVALQRNGHIVGLHSHTHPTAIDAMSKEEQKEEFVHNNEVLAGLLDASPDTMSHPNGRYNDETLVILQSIGVQIGFRADMAPVGAHPLTRPRIDQADLRQAMNLI